MSYSIELSGRVDGEDSEYWFCLPAVDLRHLAQLLDHIEAVVKARIGDVILICEPSSPEQLIITERDGNEVAIVASQPDFHRLAQKLKQVADATESADFLSHVHLDNWVTSPAIPHCDVVFQRIDRFNP